MRLGQSVLFNRRYAWDCVCVCVCVLVCVRVCARYFLHVNACVLCMWLARGWRPLAFKDSPPPLPSLKSGPFSLILFFKCGSISRGHCLVPTRKTRPRTYRAHRRDVCSNSINLFISFSETLDKFIEEENGTRPWSRDLRPDRAMVGAIVFLTYSHTHAHTNTHIHGIYAWRAADLPTLAPPPLLPLLKVFIAPCGNICL